MLVSDSLECVKYSCVGNPGLVPLRAPEPSPNSLIPHLASQQSSLQCQMSVPAVSLQSEEGAGFHQVD